MKRVILLSVYACLAGAAFCEANAETPTFNCSGKDLSSVEKLICSDTQLAMLDRELAAVFSQALAKDVKTPHSILKPEQRGWIKGRNDCWKEKDIRACVVSEYKHRMVELRVLYGLELPASITSYVCERNEAHELIVRSYNTDPRTVVTEHGDDTVLMFPESGKGEKAFEGKGQTLNFDSDGSVHLAAYFGATPITCVKRSAKMHSSWDQDNDGVNDCEKDGTCDHTVDYAKPRSTE